MAYRGVCPDMACQRIAIEKKRQRSENAACKIVAEELGLPLQTIRTWIKREKIGSNEPRKKPETNQETCQISDLESLVEKRKKFGTIYADCPWPYENQATRSATSTQYDTMSLTDICALPIDELTTENAHLHLWTTNAFLFESKDVIESWGFEYKSCFVWVKQQMGIGNYWRVSHEFLLLGVKGSCPFYEKNHKSWLELPRGKHSVKPEEIPEIIEKVSPGPYLELFARRGRKNWTVWGNEIEKTLFDGSL